MNKSISLLDFCEEEAITHIECVSCKHTEVAPLEALEAIDAFYANGWRTRRGSCYCPKCSNELKIK